MPQHNPRLDKIPVSAAISNCGAQEDKFIPLDATKYEINNAVTTEVPHVIPIDDGNLLSSVCSVLCARKDNSPLCIGFSNDISISRSCKLYTEVEVDSATAAQDVFLR